MCLYFVFQQEQMSLHVSVIDPYEDNTLNSPPESTESVKYADGEDETDHADGICFLQSRKLKDCVRWELAYIFLYRVPRKFREFFGIFNKKWTKSF